MSKHITLSQLQTVVTGMATKNDARFTKISDVVNSTSSTETTKPGSAYAVKQAYDLANGKQSPATSIAGYGITDAYTKTEVDNKISEVSTAAYKPGGSKASVAELPTLAVNVEGYVYNMTADFETTADFVEGAGKAMPAGTNVVVVNTAASDETPVYKFDTLAGVYGVATQSGNGLMSSTDKAKLDSADVTAYTEGNGIDITSHEVSLVLDNSSTNGLSVGASGLALAAAAPSSSGVGGSAGAMSAVDKEKLDGFTEATDQEVQAILDNVWPSA